MAASRLFTRHLPRRPFARRPLGSLWFHSKNRSAESFPSFNRRLKMAAKQGNAGGNSVKISPVVKIPPGPGQASRVFSMDCMGILTALCGAMGIGSISNVLSFMPPPVGSIAGVAGSLFGSGSTTASSAPANSSTPATTTQLSPVGSLINQLQQVLQSNPGKFAKITSAIAHKLQTAAGKVQAKGDTALANKLNSLSQEFQTASQTGQMPSLSNLQALVTGSGSQGLGLAAAYQNSSQSSMHVLSALTSSIPPSII
jgi:hypothetical protein